MNAEEEAKTQNTGGDTAQGTDAPGVDKHAGLTLHQLQLLHGLSNRAMDVCIRNGLLSLSALQAYAAEHGGFLGLVGCGKRSAIELEDLLAACGRVRPSPAALNVHAGTEAPTPVVPAEPTVDLELLVLLYAGLSVRAQHALQKYVGTTDPQAILELFVQSTMDPKTMRNVGVKTQNELLAFRQNALQKAFAAVAALPPAPARPHAALYRELNSFFSAAEMEVVSRAPFITEQGTYDPWPLIRSVLVVWSSRSDLRYQVLSKWLAMPPYQRTIGQIAALTGITGERVRQLLAWWNKRLHAELRFLHGLQFAADVRPMLCLQDGFQLITAGDVQLARERGSGDLPTWFLAQLLAAFDPMHASVLPWERVFGNNQWSRKLGERMALIVDPAAMPAIVEVLHAAHLLASEPRHAPELVPWDVLKSDTTPSPLALVPVMCAVLPLTHPGVRVDTTGIHLPPNKRPQLAELLEEALERLGGPSPAHVIQQELAALDPGRAWPVSSIRSTAIREKERFTSFGRTSTYGLRRWDLERPDIRSGTIRDIVADVLAKASRPLHINEITLAVLRYRPTTNPRNIRTNLQLDESGRFRSYAHGYTGLAGVDHSTTMHLLRPLNGSFFRQAALARYIGHSVRAASEQMAARAGVLVEVLEATLRLMAMEGRLQVDAKDVIVGMAPATAASEPSEENWELPFGWS